LAGNPGSLGQFVVQVLLLALVGSIVGIGIALLIVALIGASPPWLIVAWTIPIILALALLSALYPLWQLWRVEPAEVLRQDSLIVASPKGAARLATWIGQYVPAVLSMAFRNLARSRLRSLIALGSLFLSAGLLTVMIVGLFAFRQSLQGTLLGNFVLLQTAIPQLAGAVVALLLTFLSVADLLLLQVRERQHEIGLLQAVGWEPRIVQSLFVQEGIVLALAATIPGVLLALGILALQHQITGTVPAPLIGLGAIVLMLLVAMLAAWPAIRAMRRLPLSDILRAE
jgi:putative ABC transport system permease protein